MEIDYTKFKFNPDAIQKHLAQNFKSKHTIPDQTPKSKKAKTEPKQQAVEIPLLETFSDDEHEQEIEENLSLVAGKIFKRKSVHDKYKGQRFGGISTSNSYPFVFLFSNGFEFISANKTITRDANGYCDRFQENNQCFYFSGEGQKGDQKFSKGNLAIKCHQIDRKKLFLFIRVEEGFVKLIGEVKYAGHTLTIGQDIDQKNRRVIEFELQLIPGRHMNIQDIKWGRDRKEIPSRHGKVFKSDKLNVHQFAL